eukprot:g6718.t1
MRASRMRVKNAAGVLILAVMGVLAWLSVRPPVLWSAAAQQAPVEPRSIVPFPKTVHFTWKTQTLPSWAVGNWESWAQHNPGWKRVLWDDAAVDTFVRQNLPEIMPFWRSAMKPVQRADVFRYLVLLVHGGVYADIDVTCTRPVEAWFTQAAAYYNANIVVGFEEVTDRKDWRKWFATQFQVVQWTMGSVPRHAVLRGVLDEILRYYRAGRHLRNKSIIKSTGPGIWSVAIAKHVRERYGIDFGTPPFTHKALKSRGIHAGDVLILPKAAFASQGGAGGDAVMVRHNFRGTWKKGYVPQADEGGAGSAVNLAATATAAAAAGAAVTLSRDASAAYSPNPWGGIPGVMQECEQDKKKLCAGVKPGGGRTHKCLEGMKAAGKLSPACAKSATFVKQA